MRVGTALRLQRLLPLDLHLGGDIPAIRVRRVKTRPTLQLLPPLDLQLGRVFQQVERAARRLGKV